MLPHIHRATQKFYIFLIVYLTGCTPMYRSVSVRFATQMLSKLPSCLWQILFFNFHFLSDLAFGSRQKSANIRSMSVDCKESIEHTHRK